MSLEEQIAEFYKTNEVRDYHPDGEFVEEDSGRHYDVKTAVPAVVSEELILPLSATTNGKNTNRVLTETLEIAESKPSDNEEELWGEEKPLETLAEESPTFTGTIMEMTVTKVPDTIGQYIASPKVIVEVEETSEEAGIGNSSETYNEIVDSVLPIPSKEFLTVEDAYELSGVSIQVLKHDIFHKHLKSVENDDSEIDLIAYADFIAYLQKYKPPFDTSLSLTVNEVADELNLTYATVFNHVKRGNFKAVPCTRPLRLFKKSIVSYLTSKKRVISTKFKVETAELPDIEKFHNELPKPLEIEVTSCNASRELVDNSEEALSLPDFNQVLKDAEENGLTPFEISQQYRLPLSETYPLIESGVLAAVKDSKGAFRVDKESLDRYLQSLTASDTEFEEVTHITADIDLDDFLIISKSDFAILVQEIEDKALVKALQRHTDRSSAFIASLLK